MLIKLKPIFKMKRLLLVIGTLFSFQAYAQNIEIELKQSIGFGPFQPDGSSILFEPPVGTPLYKTISEFPYNDIPTNLTDVKKGVILFDMLQFLYQNSFKDLDPKLYVQYKNEKQFKISNDDLSKEPIKCFVKVIIGTTPDGVEVYLLDENQDDSFLNEQQVVMDKLESISILKNKNYKTLNTFFEIKNGDKIIKEILPIAIYKNKDSYSHSIPSYHEGKQTIDGKDHSFLVSHQFRFPDYWIADLIVDNKMDSIVEKNHYFKIGNKKFKNLGADVRTKKLTLEEVDLNFKEFKLEDFSQKDIRTNELIDIKAYKGKYILIDFWGSWCGPCLSELPELLKIYDKIDKSKIEVIGVAGRDSYDAALKSIIEINMPWKNILSTDDNKLTEIYNIAKYPYGILIDPNGNIIEKDVSVITLRPTLRKYNL